MDTFITLSYFFITCVYQLKRLHVHRTLMQFSLFCHVWHIWQIKGASLTKGDKSCSRVLFISKVFCSQILICAKTVSVSETYVKRRYSFFKNFHCFQLIKSLLSSIFFCHIIMLVIIPNHTLSMFSMFKEYYFCWKSSFDACFKRSVMADSIDETV